MPTFGVMLNKDVMAKKFIKDTNQRLTSPDIKRNPFTGFAHLIEKGNEYLAIIQMNSMVPNIGFIGWIYAVVVFIFFGLTWWLLGSLFFFLCGWFHSTTFLRLILRLGLNKAGYDRKIYKLKSNELLDMVVEELRNGSR